VFRRAGGRAGGGARAWLPVGAAAAATPLARPVLLPFLDGGDLAAGVEGVTLRLGLLVAALLALHTYDALVRSPDRAALDAHPALPALLHRALLVRAARGSVWMWASAAVLLLPIGLSAGVLPWAAAVGAVGAAWICGLGVGAAVNLGSVWAARSPTLRPLLDLVRGDNPTAQAALIYAPGLALALSGLAVAWGAAGAAALIGGHPEGVALLAVPILLGLGGLLGSAALARRHLVLATQILGEVAGQHALRQGAAAEADEPRRVYLEWLAGDRPELLRQLRNGWRAHRSWAVGAWLLGLSSLLAGWSQAPGVHGRLLAVGAGAALLIGGLPLRLAAGDPPWLGRALGLDPRGVGAARAAVAVLYLQGALIPGLLAGLLRHGAGVLLVLGGVELVGVFAASAAAALAGWRGPAGAWGYGAAAGLAWAALVGGLS
jgi:hypothetical protein